MTSINEVAISAMRDTEIFSSMIQHTKDMNSLILELARTGHMDLVMKLYSRPDVSINTLLRCASCACTEDFLVIIDEVVNRVVEDEDHIAAYTPIITKIKLLLPEVVDNLEGKTSTSVVETRTILIDNNYMSRHVEE